MKLRKSWVLCLVMACTAVTGSLTLSGVAQASNARSTAAVFTIRLEDQFLATLHYLPVTFVPAVVSSTTTTTTSTTTTTTTTLPSSTTSTTTTPPATTTTTTAPPTTTTTKPPRSVTATKIIRGNFVWRFNSFPLTLRSLWNVGANNVILQGALMRFQSVKGFATTGQMDGTTWKALTSAVLRRQVDPLDYDYVYVNKVLPESVKLYVNGVVEFTSLANTGVSAAPTVNGTFPVYLRFTTTTMSGFLPDGKAYDDTGIPWVSYFNGGDALHGFIRSSYGYPQSLGCVEMPFANAAKLWPHTPIGTLVTVH